MNADLADKLEAELERVRTTFGTLEYCTHMTLVLPPTDIRLVIAALRASQKDGAEASGWRPISEAPKDGTLFLAYAAPGQHDLPELYSLCAWHPDAGFCIDELREPTHWRPLPAPPSASQETGKGGGE